MADVQRLPRNGMTVRELAARIGKSPRTVERYTSEPREAYESRARQRHERIRALRAEGLSMRAIANEVGVTVSTVHYALSKTPPTDD